ncbi:hypothetical protein AOY11_25275 [Mycobacteroides abscessus]|nr:hypothetical protein [Mycobacteroides abscessus]ALM19094.1 hypothetical protein AOY11_25275 [Mycobacteroides abscessus]
MNETTWTQTAAEDVPPELLHEVRALLAEFEALDPSPRVQPGRDGAAGGTRRHGRRGGRIRSRLHRGAAGRGGGMTGPVYDDEDIRDDGEQWPDEERDRD